MMPTIQDYAQLTNHVYARTDENRTPVPLNWTELGWLKDDALTGFSAGWYQNGSDIVIAYTGTNETKLKDMQFGYGSGVDLPTSQVMQAMTLYFKVREQNPSANITFTGHSLGAGLAALMAVYFNKSATVFDEAPFELAAKGLTSTLFYSPQFFLDTLGASDPEYSAYYDALATGSLYDEREGNVTTYSVENEVLAPLRAIFGTIGTPTTPIPIGQQSILGSGAIPSPSGMIELHSMTLLAAMLTSSSFKDVVPKLPQLLELVFDKNLYARDPQVSETSNFIDKLYIEQVSNPETPTLGNFAADLEKLTSTSGTTSQHEFQKALIVAAMDYYYLKDADSATALFSASTGAINFNYKDIGNVETLSLPLLVDAASKLDEKSAHFIRRYASDALSWHIQSGTSALSWTASNEDNSAAVGGTGTDLLSGSTGQDLLIGLDGADTLQGGDGADLLVGGDDADQIDGGFGSDYLYGGSGADIYNFTGSFGSDWVIDSDGLGSIVVDDQTVNGATTKKITDGVYTDGTWGYTVVDDGHGGKNLVLRRGSSLNAITIRGWSAEKKLGITLNETPFEHQSNTTLNGDFGKRSAGNSYITNASGYESEGPQVNAQDVLIGSMQADSINGLGGNDGIAGNNGDDVIDGGAGDDLILGGLGADVIRGGSGGDHIFGSGSGGIERPTSVNFTPPAASGVEIARGFSWVVYNPDGLDAQGNDAYTVAGAGVMPVAGDAGNVIDSGAGDDYVYAGTGADIVHGGDGNDEIQGMDLGDVLYGDAGNDLILGDGYQGSHGNYAPLDRHGNDILVGGAGNDTMGGQGGDDDLYGGSDDDKVWGDDSSLKETPESIHGNDYLDGASGNDELTGGGKDDELFGGAGNDSLWGDDTMLSAAAHGRDYLDGEEGDDELVGGGKADELFGGADNDSLWGDDSALSLADHGDDYLDGEDGNDQLSGQGGNDELFGGDGLDTMAGDEGNDYLDGEAGADQLAGNDGDDTLYGGVGNDSLWGDTDSTGTGADHLNGEDGDDMLVGFGGADKLAGGLGKDTLLGGEGGDELSGDDGNDQLSGDRGDDYLVGGAGNDLIQGGDGDDAARGDSGFDLLYGQAGKDDLDGGSGNDVVQGGEGNDTLMGGADDDFVAGELGDDVVDGGDGNDEVQGNDGHDTLSGGTGDDTLFGLIGNDVVDGGDGADYVDGGGENDSLMGGAGSDWLLGGAGNDTLEGGAGDDILSGGSGADVYVFGRGAGHDIIANDDPSSVSQDVLRFAPGVLMSDIYANSYGNDLVLMIADTGDSVTIRNYYTTSSRISAIQFADGSSVLESALPWYRSSPTGSGVVYGASNSNDVFGGAQGVSSYVGGGGSDTYMVGAHSGLVTIIDQGSSSDIDTLLLAPEISPVDVIFERTGNSLLIRQRNSSTHITVADYFLNATNGIERIEFASDGTVWNRSAIAQRFMVGSEQDDQLIGTTGADVLNGLGGNDNIDGGAGNDVLDGGAGQDTLMGGAGNDSYRFGVGYGQDTIVGESGADALDAIVMQAGVMPADVAVRRDGDDLVLSITASLDSLRISGYFYDHGVGTTIGTIEQIQFGDGTVWDASVIRSKLPLPTDAPEVVRGYETNDSLNGMGGVDTVYGGRGDDTLDGGLGNDWLVGGAGTNTYLFGVGSGQDAIDAFDNGTRYNTVKLGAGFAPQSIVAARSGGDLLLFDPSGTDQLTIVQQFAGRGVDQIVFNDGTVWDANTLASFATTGMLQGTQGNDSLIGTSANDVLNGHGGNDTLQGGGGADTMTGGSGDDSYTVGEASDLVVENAAGGTDAVTSAVTYTLSTHVENLTLGEFGAINGTGNTQDNLLTGNSANNVLTGAAGNDTLDGGLGNDSLLGGSGNDSYIVDSTTDVITENANEGIDTVVSSVTYTLGTNIDSLILTGLSAINGTGNALANVLIGNAANNLLNGSTGADTLQGAAGDDTYVVDNAGDVIMEAVGEGTDIVNTSITHTLGANVENLTLTGTAAINATGNGLDNVLTGNSGNNVLTGGQGHDTYVITSGDTVVENANEGIDKVLASHTYVLGTNVENLTLTGTSRINGTGNGLNNHLIGNTANNSLTGGAGDDRLEGGGGTDTLVGGAGNDYFVIGASGVTVTENANEGTDTVQSTITYTLGANLENLVLSGSAAINGTGNTLNNVITGNALNNVLSGGTGADTLVGGAGDDTYTLDNLGDVVTENAGEGIDTVQTSVTHTLGSNVERLTLTGTAAVNGTGNALSNVLTGNSAANVLTGGAGDDTYIVGSGDTVIEVVNEGIDSVQSAVTWTLSTNIENLTLTGTTAINGTGNALNNVLTGNSAANVLTGGAGDDTYIVGTGDTAVELADGGIDTVQSSVTSTLGANVENLMLTGTTAINGTGNALNNVLTGNSAANVLTGGAGDDTYVVGSGDTVVENAGAGVDTVQSSVTFTLAANVENLTLTGTAAANGIGNVLNNLLLGNSANNLLDGGAGQDTMVGGSGDDTYVIDNIGDVVLENADEGSDTVQTTASYVAGGYIENVTLLGAVAINATGDSGNNALTGNSASNMLTGGAGHDTLNGGGGADTLVGGAGDDTYIISAPGVTIIENSGEGIDSVQVGTAYTLSDNFENLALTGTAHINGTGNGLANTLTGNVGNNVLDGAGGIDTLNGGDGDDTLMGAAGSKLIGGAGNDRYILTGNVDLWSSEADGSGVDTIETDGNLNMYLSSYWGSDARVHYVGDIENGTLTGSGNTEIAFDNDLNNVLTGNSGNNHITARWGNDTLYGGGGNDRLYGGDGNNSLVGGAGNDTLVSDMYGSVDTLSGGTGDDWYELGVVNTTVVENTNEGIDTVDVGGYLSSYTLGANLENLYGHAQAALTGNGLNNVITGGGSGDTLSGMAGDDTLVGAGGADTMIGGTGDDRYIIDSLSDVVTENVGEGVDTVQSAMTYTLAANVEALILTGFSAINGTGNALDNTLTGNLALNVLTGGAGNDTYVISSGDTVVENAGEGIDLVQADFSYTLGANLENLTLTGMGSLNATGNAAANTLTGNAGNNILDGRVGADTLNGGLGNDTYIVDDATDVVVENASEGVDTVKSSVAITLAANVENLTLTGSQSINGTGNGLANVLVGNSAANVLSGGLGDDSYVISDTLDTVVENANEGIDTVQSEVTYTLGSNVENLMLTGNLAISGYGNALANTLVGNTNAQANTLAGGLGDDTYLYGYNDTIVENANEGIDTVKSDAGYTLASNVENLVLTGYGAISGTGNALANMLTGNDANNTLNGLSGADTMAGGKSDDTYVVDHVGDVVSEYVGEGVDTVQSSISYALATNVENLTLIGTAAIDGTGNALSNILTGNGAVNSLAGGAGDDTYTIDAGDVVVEGANEGIDTIQVALSHTLGANIENLTLLGAAAINGTGNSLDNLLTGNAGANVLTGGAGNDTYVVGLSDTAVELASEGVDTVRSDATFTLGANVENLILLDAGGTIHGTGNSLNNTLTGNGYANVLTGGAGDDTYVVGSGDATIELADEGIDTVMSSVTRVLADYVENLTLTGTLAISGTGNNLDNALTGNAANNTLDGLLGGDQMAAGAGNDIYVVDNAGDVVIENAGEGVDAVLAAVDYTLSANVENLSLNGVEAVSGTGNGLNNAMTGTVIGNVLMGLAGNDTLDGGMGADTLIGGVGDDTYVVDNMGDQIVENSEEGLDAIQSRIDLTLTENVENLTLQGIAAVRATGNAGNNALVGNVANNVLDGGAGSDTLSGGLGDDTYFVDNGGDTVVENIGEGVDTVFSSGTFTLAANLENLTLTDSGAINGMGNSAANVLTGNEAANTLTGGGGGDTYRGGLGNDTLIASVVTSNDVYVWGRGEGADTLTDSGGMDQLRFLADVAADQVWLRRVTNNLEVSVIGTADSFTITDWYTAEVNQIESFKLADGKALTAANVQQLVNAMAAFTPPAVGQTSIPDSYRGSLDPLIAANWR